jgi:membrane-bound ClpP family serine protease
LVLRASLRVHRLPVFDPLARVAGAHGVATSALTPDGTVRVLHETWSAMTTGSPIARGEAVEVVAREGLTLHVRPMVRSGERGGLPSQGAVRPGVWVERGR